MSKSHRQHARPDTPERSKRTPARMPLRASESLLALQRGAGNRAVAALVSRDKKPPAKPPPKPPPDGIYAIVPGIGTITLESAQVGIRRSLTSPTGRGTSRDTQAEAPPEIVVTSLIGDHSDKIFQAAMGGSLGNVELRFVKGGKVYMTMKLSNAMVTSYSVSGHGGDSGDRPLESWTLNATKIEYETDQKASPESTTSEWNLAPDRGS